MRIKSEMDNDDKGYLRPIFDYACPAWGHLADTYMRKMQAFQSLYLRIIVGAPWFVRNETLHRDLDMPTIMDQFRGLGQSFYARLPGATNPLILGLGNYVINPGSIGACYLTSTSLAIGLRERHCLTFSRTNGKPLFSPLDMTRQQWRDGIHPPRRQGPPTEDPKEDSGNQTMLHPWTHLLRSRLDKTSYTRKH
uniref:Uncharacterized protein n=1 Tax=Timema douglasi TaxID=61478 RepID=A0A7R8VKS4_TIMDO|nr:unnamed protein product [Timema douglasi]